MSHLLSSVCASEEHFAEDQGFSASIKFTGTQIPGHSSLTEHLFIDWVKKYMKISGTENKVRDVADVISFPGPCPISEFAFCFYKKGTSQLPKKQDRKSQFY